MGIKNKIVKFLFELGGHKLAKIFTKSYPRILMYHRFCGSTDQDPHKLSVDQFENQIKYLTSNFQVVGLDDVMRAATERSGMPRVCITIDDGYDDFYEFAYPILKKYNMPAIFYIATNFVDKVSWFWYDRIRWCLDNSDLESSLEFVSNFEFYKSINLTSKEEIWQFLISQYLLMDPKIIEQKIRSFSDHLKLKIPELPPEEFSPVSWQKIKEMSENGIEIGAHSLSHYSLGAMDRVLVVREIVESKKRIENMIGCEVKHFCFPNGQNSDVPKDYNVILKEAGLSSSVVAFYDRHGLKDRYAMRRHGVGSDFYAFRKAVCGVDRIGAVLLNKNSAFDWGRR